MASHRAPARVLVLVAAAAIAAMPLTSGLTALAPAQPVRAAEVYPDLDATFFGGTWNSIGASIASAGVVDLTATQQDGEPEIPSPATVTGQAGGQPLQGAAILTRRAGRTPLAETRLVDLNLEDLPVEIPLSTIPFQRSIPPTSWSGLLAGTALAGIPLQSVTLARSGCSRRSRARSRW